jgi:hypothetical protein
MSATACRWVVMTGYGWALGGKGRAQGPLWHSGVVVGLRAAPGARCMVARRSVCACATPSVLQCLATPSNTPTETSSS